MNNINEDALEQAMLSWLGDLGYEILHGPDIAQGEVAEERNDYSEAILPNRLRSALARINRHISGSHLDDAIKKLRNISSPSLAHQNRDFHKLLVDGIEIEVRKSDGSIRGERVQLVDYVLHPA